MLELNGVALTLDDIPVLRDASLSVAEGEIVAILGPNGAGKSTLLKVASGELAPDGGQVALGDQPLTQLSLVDKARGMAVLPQYSQLDFPFSAQDVVLLGRHPHDTGAEVDHRIAAQALEKADVSYLARQLYTHLSGGEKQRVQLARVMAQVWPTEGKRSRLLVLDEPTSALDYSHQQLIMRSLRDFANEGGSVLMAIHDLNLAATFADRLALMSCGEIKASGAVDEVLKVELLEDVFNTDFCRVQHPHTGRPWLIHG